MLNFYDVDKTFIAYLKAAEIEQRGFTRVPNMEYEGHAQKFLCGIVLSMNGYNYYVPVSSQTKRMPDSIFVKIPTDKHSQIKGTLKFNFMIPVPDCAITIRCIKDEPSPARQRFLNGQLRYCQSIEDAIMNQARRTYQKRLNGTGSPSFMEQSCMFDLLEEKCKEYEATH